MIEIANGSADSVKTEMKQFAKQSREKIKDIKKKHKEETKDKKDKSMPGELQDEIDRLTEKQRIFYSPTRVIPIRIGQLVINFKAYQAFMKKLNEAPLVEVALEHCFRVEHASGRLDLTDLSEHYTDFKHIPIGKLADESET